MPEAFLPVCIIGLLALALLLVVSGIRHVPPASALVVFRLGRFAGLRGFGRTFLIPFIDQGKVVDLRVQPQSISPLELLLSGRTRLAVNLEYTFQVTDPAAYVLNVANPIEALRQLIGTTCKTLAADLNRANFLIQRNKLQDELFQRVRPSALNWGIELHSIEIHVLD